MSDHDTILILQKHVDEDKRMFEILNNKLDNHIDNVDKKLDDIIEIKKAIGLGWWFFIKLGALAAALSAIWYFLTMFKKK